MSDNKYIAAKDLLAAFEGYELDIGFEPMSQDSYNEAAIIEAIKATGRVQELMCCAINMACIGYGNKRFGNYKLNNLIKEIQPILQACGVKIALTQNAKLAEADLTPQRLCRAFRQHIRKYLLDHPNFNTYMFKKYSDQDIRFRTVLFRGAEYLDSLNAEEVESILQAYGRMEDKFKLNMSDRVIRVFQAKGHTQRK
jgi:hypothetical protein